MAELQKDIKNIFYLFKRLYDIIEPFEFIPIVMNYRLVKEYIAMCIDESSGDDYNFVGMPSRNIIRSDGSSNREEITNISRSLQQLQDDDLVDHLQNANSDDVIGDEFGPVPPTGAEPTLQLDPFAKDVNAPARM